MRRRAWSRFDGRRFRDARERIGSQKTNLAHDLILFVFCDPSVRAGRPAEQADPSNHALLIS